MKTIRERYDALVNKNTYRRDEIRAEISALEKTKPRNVDEWKFNEAEIKRLRGLL